jgi:hypothetical protein
LLAQHCDGEEKTEAQLKPSSTLFERIVRRLEGLVRVLQRHVRWKPLPLVNPARLGTVTESQRVDEQVSATDAALVAALCEYGVSRDVVDKLAAQRVSPTWRTALDSLAKSNCSAIDLANMIEKDATFLDARTAAQYIDFVQEMAGSTPLTEADWWSLLAGAPTPITCWRSLRNELGEWLQLLQRYSLVDPEVIRPVISAQMKRPMQELERMECVLAFVTADPPNGCGFEPGDAALKRLLMRATWLLSLDDLSTALSVLQYFCRDLCLCYAPYLRQIIYAYPEILQTDIAHLRAIHEHLTEHAHLSAKSVGAMIRSYPRCLGLSLTQIERVTNYLRCLGLHQEDLSKIYRAFPALLALDIEQEAEPVVSFFREHGLTDIASLVRGLPPVLLYDIEEDLRPKLKFLQSAMNMNIQLVLEFPAFFSYSLRDRIAPRLLYLRRLGASVSRLRLSMVIAPSDADFCRRVVCTPEREFLAFKEEFHQLIASRLQQVTKRAADAKRNDETLPQVTNTRTSQR